MLVPRRCCEARSAQLESCTDPITISVDAPQDDLCPSPPLLSVSDVSGDNVFGRLDSDSTYVAEYLLTDADRADTLSDFFRRNMAGFVITTRRDPPLSICGCTNPSTTDGILDFLESPNETLQCPYYEYNRNISSGSGNATSHGPLSGCYVIEPGSSVAFQDLSCPNDRNSNNDYLCGEDERTVSATYPDQTEAVTVTVWYNNQVLTHVHVVTYVYMYVV